MKLSNLALLLIAAVFCVLAGAGRIAPPGADINYAGGLPNELNYTFGVPQMGYAEVLTYGWRKTWPADPTDKDKRQVVRYCYCNGESRNKLQKLFDDAGNLWITALGGEAGSNTGHNLAFREVTDKNGNTAFCFPSWEKFGKTGPWNSQIDGDVLAVAYDPDNGPMYSSTLGYQPSGVNGRHWMRVHPSGPEGAKAIAHELGHTIGMMHEHQRRDRDDVIFFNCYNLVGYKEAVARAKADGAANFSKRLCNELDYAEKYKFNAAGDYLKAASGDGWATYPQLTDGPNYDFKSIMHYPSIANAADPKCKDDIYSCPLAKWVDNGSGGWKYERLERNEKPSAQDCDFVTKFYPWVGK